MLALYPPAHAVDINIGGSVLFNWWNPAWNNGKIILHSPDLLKIPFSNWPVYRITPSYCYGPDLSIRFLRNIDVAASFRYSQSDMTGSGPSLFPNIGTQKVTVSYDLYDIYARAGYYVLEFLMPYAGLRVELVNTTIEFDQLKPTVVYNMTHAGMKGEILKFTPELGLHFAVPLSSFFTFIFDCSGTFQSGSDKLTYLNMFDQWKPQFNFSPIPNGRFYAVGCSSLMAFKFNIPKIDTSISLGGYYRLLSYMQKTQDRSMFVINGFLDHTYGITCSVVYTFSTSKSSGKRVWIPRPSYPSH